MQLVSQRGPSWGVLLLSKAFYTVLQAISPFPRQNELLNELLTVSLFDSAHSVISDGLRLFALRQVE